VDKKRGVRGRRERRERRGGQRFREGRGRGNLLISFTPPPVGAPVDETKDGANS